MSDIRLGIIGAGNLASMRIYPCLHMLPIRLVAVCDLDREKAERNARKFGAEKVYTDHQQMLAAGGLDAIIICVGPDLHARLAVEVMEAGLPVYTEKPPAVRAADAYAMWETSRRLGMICMTGFKKRFAPAYQKARAAIASDGFGVPTLLSIDYACGPTYPNNPDDPRSQFLLDFCVHIIDLSRFLCGDVAEVYARETNETTYAVHLVFESGGLGVLALSANRAWAVATEKVEVTGGPGQFISVDNSVRMVRHIGDTIAEWHDPSFSTARGDSLVETGFQPELAAFVDAVREGHEPESSISSSYRTMCLYEAIAQSARERSVVVVENVQLAAVR